MHCASFSPMYSTSVINRLHSFCVRCLTTFCSLLYLNNGIDSLYMLMIMSYILPSLSPRFLFLLQIVLISAKPPRERIINCISNANCLLLQDILNLSSFCIWPLISIMPCNSAILFSTVLNRYSLGIYFSDKRSFIMKSFSSLPT